MTGRNSLAAVAALALAVMLLTAGGARAESEGPYVHGQLRVDDEDVFFCYEPYREKALMMAKSYNAFLLNGKNKDGSAYLRFKALVSDTTDNKKCVAVDGMDHRSLITIYEGPESLRDEDRWNVVKSRQVGGSFDYDFYVMTTEKVPPVPSELRCIDQGTC